MGYNFEIHFKPGKENTVADAVNRVDIPIILAISYPKASWLDELRAYLSNNQIRVDLVATISLNPD